MGHLVRVVQVVDASFSRASGLYNEGGFMKLKSNFCIFSAVAALIPTLVACGGGGGSSTSTVNINENPLTQDPSVETSPVMPGSDMNPQLQLETGLELRTLDGDGLWTDGVLLHDDSMPTFAYDAHIDASPRFANFPVGGLTWSGFLNIEEPGEHVIRVNFSVGIPDSGQWSVNCSVSGSIGNVSIGESDSITYQYNLSNNDRSFDTGREILASGPHEFELTAICVENFILTRVTGWDFDQGHYRFIVSDIEILGPSDVAFRAVPNQYFQSQGG